MTLRTIIEEAIKDEAAERDIELTEEELRSAVNGVEYCISEAMPDSIDTALSNVMFDRGDAADQKEDCPDCDLENGELCDRHLNELVYHMHKQQGKESVLWVLEEDEDIHFFTAIQKPYEACRIATADEVKQYHEKGEATI